MINKSKNRGEIILLTVAIIGFIAACVPAAYNMYCRHKDYVKQINEFIHSDVVTRNNTNQQALFVLISIDMKTGRYHQEFSVTVEPKTEEQIPDWIENQIKKEHKMIIAKFTITSNSATINCPRLSLNDNVLYKLTESSGEFSCEFSATGTT